jgi:Na+/H+-translocating membrane pyrophosphatase
VSKIRFAVAGFIALAAPLALPAAAHADCSVPGASCSPPVVGATVLAQGGFVSPAVAPAAAQVAPAAGLPPMAPASGSQLPFTGGDVAGLSIVGAGLLGAGVVLVRRNRVRSAKTV